MIRMKSEASGRGLGVLLTAVMAGCCLLTTATFVTDLQASVDEPEAAGAVLPRPRDMNADSLDEIDKRLQPEIAVLWDPAQTTSARMAAFEAVKPVIAELLNSADHRLTAQKLHRRVALIGGVLAAAEAKLDVIRPTAFQESARESAIQLDRALRRIRNGSLWVSYLQLQPLLREGVSLEQLQAFQSLANVTDEMDEAQREFVSRGDIQELNKLVEAAISEMTRPLDDSELRQELSLQLDRLVRGILQDEVLPVSTSTAEARSAWRVIRAQFPSAADALRPILNECCLGHNVHVAVAEPFVSRLIASSREESGKISERAMGATITGDQQTSVSVDAEFLPSDESARLNIFLQGTTHTEKVARKSPATVFSEGNHTFRVSKEVIFGGEQIELGRTQFSADINNRVRNFRTDYDGRLFGRAVRREAGRQISASQSATDAETRRQLQADLVPRFEQEVGGPFDELNAVLQSLRERGLGPDQIDASSTDSEMTLSLRSIGTDYLGGSVPPTGISAGDGVSVQLHQSMFNLLLGGLGLQGRVVNQNELTGEIEKALTEMLGREISLSRGTKSADSEQTEEEAADERETFFVFSETDPLRVQFAEGEVSVLIQTGIRQEGRAELAVHTIVIPIQIQLTEAGIELTPQRIRVLSAPITVANQLRKVIGSRISEQQLSATLNLSTAEGGEAKTVTVTNLQLADGWLTISLR